MHKTIYRCGPGQLAVRSESSVNYHHDCFRNWRSPAARHVNVCRDDLGGGRHDLVVFFDHEDHEMKPLFGSAQSPDAERDRLA